MLPLRHALLALALLLPCAAAHAETKSPIQAQPAPTALPPGSRLPPERIEFGNLLADIQKTSAKEGELYMLLWLPMEYWTSSMAREGAEPSSKRMKRMLDVIGRYTVFAAVRGEPNPYGAGAYRGEDELLRTIRLTDAAGDVYNPLEPERVDAQMREILAFFRPAFAKMAGNVGENIHFVVFPARDRSGRPLAEATGNGLLRVRFDDVEFDYRLPLGSLLVPRRDPATGESFPGNYEFNPYTGARLETAPASK